MAVMWLVAATERHARRASASVAAARRVRVLTGAVLLRPTVEADTMMYVAGLRAVLVCAFVCVCARSDERRGLASSGL